MDANSPALFMHTSGSTGANPTGVLHSDITTYAAHHAMGFRPERQRRLLVHGRLRGWIAGAHLGPLALGATTIMFREHASLAPAGRYSTLWKIPGQHSLYHRAPAAGARRSDGEEWTDAAMTFLRIHQDPLANREPGSLECRPHPYRQGNLPIVDTWWQTEAPAKVMISFCRHKPRPGSSHAPPSINAIVDETASPSPVNEGGSSSAQFLAQERFIGVFQNERKVQKHFDRFPG